MLPLTPRHSGILFALLAACGLGAVTTLAKLLYAAGGNALTLMLVRFVLTTLLFGLLLALRGKGFGVAREIRLPLGLIGLIWSGAMICYLVAVETIEVSLAVLIFYTYPLLVLAWALLRRQLPASPQLLALFAAAFAGLVLALYGGRVEVEAAGILFAMLASLGAAFTFVAGARVAPRMSPLVMSFWVNAAGLVIILRKTCRKRQARRLRIGTITGDCSMLRLRRLGRGPGGHQKTGHEKRARAEPDRAP